MTKRPTGLDASQLARRIVQEAAGDEPIAEPPPQKNAAAVALGKLGGVKGGKARRSALSPEQRKAAALKAARARWDKTNGA